MFNVGPTELVVVLLVVLLVVGPRRLPEVGRTMGRSLKQFRDATGELRREVRNTIEDVDIRKDLSAIKRDMTGALKDDLPAGKATRARLTEPERGNSSDPSG